MVCGSCVQKIASRLVRNHRIDWIFALERAMKGLEWHEKNNKSTAKTITSEDFERLGFDPDYSQACNSPIYVRCPKANDACPYDAWCPEHTCPSGTCPAALPNSHYVSDDCSGSIGTRCQKCLGAPTGTCRAFGTCVYTGNCYYDCDDDYEWDGEACVPIVVPAKPLINKPLVNPILVNAPIIRLTPFRADIKGKKEFYS